VKPLDKEWLLENLKGVHTIVTTEENVVAGGFGSAIKELLEGENFDVRSIGIPDRFIEHGTQPKLRSLAGLSEDQIAETLLKIRDKVWTPSSGFHSN
jgi:1-deoxy-D-xylulose-5-phosphate synthase